MQWKDFVVQLESAPEPYRILRLNPRLDRLPLPIQRYDDPLLPFGKAVCDHTNDLVAAYWLDLSTYLALGAAGARALERTIRYINNYRPTILHGPFCTEDYSAMADATGFGVAALTVSDSTLMHHYLLNPPYSAIQTTTGTSDSIPVPVEGGVFMSNPETIYIRGLDSEMKSFRLTNDTVLYAGKLDDFGERIRGALGDMV